jgi:hypothetical protein
MKKTILVSIILLSGCYSLAQPKRGSMFIGGKISSSKTKIPMSLTNNSSNNISGLSISPNLGYFLSNKLALVLEMSYSTDKVDNSVINYTVTSITNYKSYNYMASLFVRYYRAISDKLYFSLNNGIGFYQFDSKNEVTNIDVKNNKTSSKTTTEKINSYTINISPGLDYFIAPHWGLRTTIGSMEYSINSQKSNNGNIQKSNNFSLNTSIINLTSLTITLNYFFDSKNEVAESD